MPIAADTVAANAIPIVFFGVALVVLAVAVSARFERRGRAAAWGGLIAYLLLILWVTLALGYGDPAGGTGGLNLTPLQEIRRALDSGHTSPWVNLLGNVALFMPLGTLIALLARGRWVARFVVATVWGLLISVVIEVSQLGLGRVADVDDVILNTLGALLGALLAPVVVSAAHALSPNYDGSRASSSAGRAADF